MFRFSILVLSGLALAVLPAPAASVLVNEYNGVADDDQLDGGNGSDSFFGTVQGNGGDWFELVVVGDGSSGSTVDMRGWTIEVSEDGAAAQSVVLSNAAYWSDVQAGTILTFIETDDAGGKDTGTQLLAEDRFLSEGWAWTNIFIGDSTYVDTTVSDADLDISNDDVTITVKDDGGTVVFGPVGEGSPTHPGSRVNSEESFVFKGDPSTGVTPSNGGFDDGDNSTFGAPNTWDDGGSVQSFTPFRTITDVPAFTTVPPGDPVVAGNGFTYDLEAADANGGTFTITAPTLPSWLSLTDNGDGTAELSGTPDNAAAGVHAVELEVTDSPNDGTGTQSFEIRVFHSTAPVIVNEYDGSSDFIELVVVGDGTPGSTVDLRDWTIRMEDEGGAVSADLILTDRPFWSDVPAGTILLFSEESAAEGGFDTDTDAADNYETQGWGLSQFWTADPDYIDTDNGSSEIVTSNDDASVSLLDGDGNLVFGPAGEGVESDGGVGGDDSFILRSNPATDVNPIDSDYGESENNPTPGAPNQPPVGGIQSFEAFATGANPNTAPTFRNEPTELSDLTTLVGFEYFWIVDTNDPNPGDNLTLTLTEGPGWLTLDDFGDGSADLFGTPTNAQAGSYDVTIEVSDGSLTASQTFTIIAFTAEASVFVNEFNGVADDELLDGGAKTDPFFGAVEGNGGDWFELVVVGDGTAGSAVDMRGWTIRVADDGDEPESIVLSQDPYWSDVRAGTILTFTEDDLDGGGLSTGIHRVNRFDDSSAEGGWAWTNIHVGDDRFVDQAASDFGGGFAVSNDETRITILDDSDLVVFGPAGEEFLDSGVNGREVFKLEEDPSTAINGLTSLFADGSSSTFGAPNEWNGGTNVQSFTAFDSGDPANGQPYFTSVSPRWARQGGPFSHDVSAEDFDIGDSLTLAIVSAPGWLGGGLSDNGDGTGVLAGTPTQSDAGLQTVTLSVSDGTAIVEKTFQLFVHQDESPVILNEYNAVDGGEFLNGGDAGQDGEGGAAADEVFGRVEGNGGDWFELVVVGDGTAGDTVDLRGWTIEVMDNATFPFAAEEVVELSDAGYWASVPAGTILTFTEKRSGEDGWDTAIEAVDNRATDGWVWTNIWIGDSTYVSYTDEETNGYTIDGATGEVSGIGISANDTQFVIRDDGGSVRFGPAGEGVAPVSGVGDNDIFELEADPTPSVSPLTEASDGPPAVDGYDDGATGSTFGRPNDWNGGVDTQDFSVYASVGGGDPFADYMDDFGLSGADAAKLADPDGDTKTNLEEFALGSAPNDAGSAPGFRTAASDDGSGPRLRITFLRRAGGSGTGASYSADDVDYTVEGSLDLVDWNEPVSEVANPGTLPVPPSGYEWATYRLDIDLDASGGTPSGFLRVRVVESGAPTP